jgi:hypothetical protein
MKNRLLISVLCFVLTGVLCQPPAQGRNAELYPALASAFSSGFASPANQAPCPPDFYGIAAEQFKACFDYWTKQGRYPVTLSAYQVGKAIYFTGSFQQVAPRYVRTLMTPQQLQQYVIEYKAQGYRPEQKSVLTTAEGPLFTVIWVKDSAPFETRSGLTQEQYAVKYKQMRAAGWINVDITPYRDDLVAIKYSGVWVKRGFSDYVTYTEMTDAEYRARFDELFKQGFRVTRFVEYKKLKFVKSPADNKLNPGFETRYAAIWEKLPGAYYHHYKMTHADFLAKYNQLSAQGFRLANVSALNQQVSAIWIK